MHSTLHVPFSMRTHILRSTELPRRSRSFKKCVPEKIFNLLMREIHLLWNLICIRLLIEAKLKSSFIFSEEPTLKKTVVRYSYLCINWETIVIRHSGIVWMKLLSATGRESALSIRRLLLISCLFLNLL